MKIVFLSNFFNHHQRPLSDQLDQRMPRQYHFIETTEIPEERLKMGYGEKNIPDYVVPVKSDEVKPIIDNTDVIIMGSAPESFIQKPLQQNKLIYRYSERPLKDGLQPHKYLPRFLRWHLRNPFGKPIYLLCASAYTAADYAKFNLFRKRAYKWGYFPPLKKHPSEEVLLAQKKTKTILWCGRFLEWKHPEHAIAVAEYLKENRYDFQLSMVGVGEKETELKELVCKRNLNNYVHFLGAMPPDQVREHMEQTDIFLFTSDRREGWGAVLNEAMNSGCAVVANHAIGSVPFMIQDGVNGMIYQNGNVTMLCEKVKYLLDHPEEQACIGLNAYHTILNEWNAEIAAERLICLSEHILAGEKYPDLYKSGPCSKAEILKDEWYQ